MNTVLNTSLEWSDLIKSYIVYTLHNLLKTQCDIQNLHETKIDIGIWNHIFNQIKYPFLYYSGLPSNDSQNALSDTLSDTVNVYPPKTFQEFVDSIANLQKMGPYDYMKFCENMNQSDFKKTIFNKYEKMEKINKIKNNMIHELLYSKDPTPVLNITELIYKYIQDKSINISQQKPDYNMFRNNQNLFYEKYTLWEIQQKYLSESNSSC